MIDGLDADDSRGDRRRVCAKVSEERELRIRWADDQDLTRVLDRIGDGIEIRRVLRRLSRADGAFLVMEVRVLRLRMQHAFVGRIRIEVDDVRFAVIDPDDAVIVAHVLRREMDVQ